MKKLFLSVVVPFVLISSASAQFYLSAGAGYAFPMAGGTNSGTGPYNGHQNMYNSIFSSSEPSYSVKQASFTAGARGSIGGGYMFNKHFGIQLEGNTGIVNNKFTYNTDYIQSGNSPSPANIKINRQAENVVLLIPSLVFQTDGNTMIGFCNIGPVLPILSRIDREENFIIYGNNSSSQLDIWYQEKNSFSVGVSAAAGMRYTVSDQFSVLCEVSSLSMSLYIKEADVKSYTENGYPSGFTPYNIRFNRSGTYSGSYGNLSYLQPFSNIGINVGIVYAPGHATKDDTKQKK